MSGPEHNPADDHQPTKEEWEAYERQRELEAKPPSAWTCRDCKRELGFSCREMGTGFCHPCAHIRYRDSGLWKAPASTTEGGSERETRLQGEICRLELEVGRLRAAVEAGDKFKKWVHDYLDAKGVPADPDPEGNAKHGCRISGRMEYVFRELKPGCGLCGGTGYIDTTTEENKVYRTRKPCTCRNGVSLLEVLFAMVVVTIGLLGVMSLLFVGAHTNARSRTADAAAAAGRAAISDFHTRGMARPDAWWGLMAAPGGGVAQAPLSPPNVPYAAPTAAWCIDPRMVAGNPTDPNAGTFPRLNTGTPGMPRMIRVNLDSGMSSPMDVLQADHVFLLGDDLMYDRLSDRSLQAQAVFDKTTWVPLKRSSKGMFSWFATLAPKPELNGAGGYYVLSVIVCEGRPGRLAPDMDVEHALPVVFQEPGDLIGDGLAGGPVMVTWSAPYTTQNTIEAEKRVLRIRRDSWVCLVGRGAGNPITRWQWYRVTASSDEPPAYHAGEGHYATTVSLSGSDWDLSLQDPHMVIVRGAVAVYEKTIQLEP